jgi:hypothetical protein
VRVQTPTRQVRFGSQKSLVCVCVLSHWVRATIVEVSDLPALKCSSLGLYLAPVEKSLVAVLELFTRVASHVQNLLPRGTWLSVETLARSLQHKTTQRVTLSHPLSFSFSQQCPPTLN